MAEGVAGLVESTSYTTYYPDGTVASVTERVSHAPGAQLMMTYVTEVLAPQTDTLGAGVHQFMLQTGAGVGQALDGLTHYDLSYTSTNYGTSRLALEHGLG
jgi:predicted MFS family arabinose efflux permease